LDLAIYETISGKRAVRTRFGPEEAGGHVVRGYTRSIDHAKALVEQVLPDWTSCEIRAEPWWKREDGRNCDATIRRAGHETVPIRDLRMNKSMSSWRDDLSGALVNVTTRELWGANASGFTMPLALIAAMLTALSALKEP
jgi:hypothetical protein